MNILTTGVRAMIMAFTGNDDREQRIRAEKLQNLGVVEIIQPEELKPQILAQKIIDYLPKIPNKINFDFAGVTKTNELLKQLVYQAQVA
jgi:predicted glycosyltransferase